MSYSDATHAALAALQRALTPEELWLASNALLHSTLPVFHTLIGLPCVGTMPVFLRTTLPVGDQEVYFARLNAVAPLGAQLAQNPGLPVMRLSDMLPDAALPGLPFYELFMKPEGWRYSAGIMFWSDTGEFIGHLALIRTEAQGDITDAEMAVLRQLQPLVNAAVSRLLAAEQRAAAHSSLEHTVQALPLPMAGIGWDLAINFANEAAREALAIWQHGTQGARALKPGNRPVLAPALRVACQEIKTDWEKALQTGTQSQFQPIRLLAHPTEAGLQVAVQLIEPTSGRSLQPSFVLQFSVARSDQAAAGQALAALSKLTAAEREVARLAAAGLDNADIVRQLSVSESTVRTHLRNIFRKLDITSRGKLAPLYRALEEAAPPRAS